MLQSLNQLTNQGTSSASSQRNSFSSEKSCRDSFIFQMRSSRCTTDPKINMMCEGRAPLWAYEHVAQWNFSLVDHEIEMLLAQSSRIWFTCSWRHDKPAIEFQPVESSKSRARESAKSSNLQVLTSNSSASDVRPINGQVNSVAPETTPKGKFV